MWRLCFFMVVGIFELFASMDNVCSYTILRAVIFGKCEGEKIHTNEILSIPVARPRTENVLQGSGCAYVQKAIFYATADSTANTLSITYKPCVINFLTSINIRAC